ncbi:Cys-Cys-COOH (seleno)protein SaoC [Paraclostridium bifermentans]|nr:Cys-Cys-COOH (seleno)protein SaoC [Paraclostridium bifermentans]
MVGVISDNENVYMTEPIRAPIDDILIEFKDIDDKNEMELILSGSKNGNVGYAIYRLENKKLVDLFGEGMNACC